MIASRRLIAPLALAIVAPACGSEMNGPAPYQPISTCTGDWQMIAPRGGGGTALVHNDGVLYFHVPAPAAELGGIWAQPTSGEPATQLVPVPYSAFGDPGIWLEGDHLVYTAGDQANQFHSVALTGGASQLLLDVSAARSGAGRAFLHDVTSTNFFWTEDSEEIGSSATTLWHAARAGGPPTQIAAPPVASPVLGIAAAGETLLVANNEPASYAFSVAGGSGGPLATRPDIDGTARYRGIASDGIFWEVDRPGEALGRNLRTLLLVPADGSPVRTIWNGIPAHSTNDAVWPDGQGGWIAATSHSFEDGHAAAMWAIDGQGNGRRLACVPGWTWLTTGGSLHTVTPAITADAVFAVAAAEDGSVGGIVRIPR
jgi:hypothetical protein